MLVCTNCNNEQDSGKFCGACGGRVQVKEVETHEPIDKISNDVPVYDNTDQIEPITPTFNNVNQSSATLENSEQPKAETIKRNLNNYWSYFLHIIENPSRSFHTNENHLAKGLVTLGLYAITYALSIYILFYSAMNALMGGMLDSSPPFFWIVSRIIFIVGVLFAISFVSALAMSKLGKNKEPVKMLLTQYSALFVPFIALNALAMLGATLNSVTLTSISLSLSSIFGFVFIPVLFVYEKVLDSNNNSKKIYLSLGTVILIGILVYILGEAIILNILEQIESWAYMYDPYR